MKRMLIDALHPEEVRVAIADNKQICEFDFVSATKQQVKGNIYLAKITRVEPSLQAAFVEYGGGKQGFLPFAEIHPDYYQIPVSDRKKLLEEVARELAEEAGDDDDFTSSDGTADTENNDAQDGSDASDEPSEEAASAGDMVDALAKRNESEAEETVEDAKQTSKYERSEDEKKTSNPVSEASETAEASEEKTAAKPRVEMKQEISVAMGAAHLAENASESTTENSADDVSAVASERESNESIDKLQEHAEATAEQENSDVETIASEEEAVRPRHKKNRVPFFKRYKIQEVVKRGQIVLVQVIKEERGNKGVSLTTYLSLAGRYCVLMPNSPRDGGVSRKISDIETRRRLKEVMAQLKLAQGMSVIIRTAGIDRSKPEIRRDFDYLVKLWNRIREGTLTSSAPALIYEENKIIKRAIRDQYTSDIEEVIVEGAEGFEEAHDFMKMLLPTHTARVKEYKQDMPLFYAYGIEEQLISMHDPVVKLRSGGYIVINPTEALISIDVNSGRSTGERNIEETAVKSNVEAAHEIARQLRLRDLAGLIVIDFIDMMDSRNRRAVERNLKDALRSDRAKIQVGRISPFGLMEMSRQRLRPSISESMHVSCPSCAGRGVVRSHDSLSLHLMRTLEKEAVSGQWAQLRLLVSEPMAMFLLNEKRRLISNIETRHGVTIIVEPQHGYAVSEFVIDKIRAPKNKPDVRGNKNNAASRSEPRVDASSMQEDMEALPDDFVEGENAPVSSESREGKGERRPRRTRGGRGRRGGRNRGEANAERNVDDANTSDNNESKNNNSAEGNDAPDTVAVEGEAPAKPARRARGGRGRGRRPWREDKNDAANDTGDVQTEASADAAVKSEFQQSANDLPQFTRSNVVEKSPDNVVDFPKSEPHAKPEDKTARPEGAPPRKGWWQQIIELD